MHPVMIPAGKGVWAVAKGDTLYKLVKLPCNNYRLMYDNPEIEIGQYPSMCRAMMAID